MSDLLSNYERLYAYLLRHAKDCRQWVLSSRDCIRQEKSRRECNNKFKAMDDALEECVREYEEKAIACQTEALEAREMIELLRYLKQKYPSVIDGVLSEVDCLKLFARLDYFERIYGEGIYADNSDYCTCPYYDY
jgi:enolase